MLRKIFEPHSPRGVEVSIKQVGDLKIVQTCSAFNMFTLVDYVYGVRDVT